MHRVAFAVVSWNTRELLARCLRSLQGEAEVWVVDNASSDGSPEMVREEFPWVRLIASEENLGFGRAVNRVAAETATPWLGVANADVALEPGAVGALLAAAERDPGAGALAPRLLLPDGTTQHSVFAFPTLAFSAAFNAGLLSVVPGAGERYVLGGHWDPARERRVPWAIGALLLVRREAWAAVGGFDERHWMYAEDLDLGWRLRRAGWATRYVPGARARHDASAAAAQAWGDGRVERTQRAAYGWLARTRGTAYTRATALVNVAGAAARWAAVAPLARARPHGRWVVRRDDYARWARAHATGLRDL